MPIPKIPRKLLLLLLAAVATAACGHAADQEACPAPEQRDCPADALTFDSGIADLVHTRCYPCHAPGGEEQSRLLTDYVHVSRESMSIRSQLATCSMPPAGAPPLSSEERQQIFDWLACRTPE
ncbi:MAG: hypothetical protein WDO69_20090 [Pseudomonadota bacterium]